MEPASTSGRSEEAELSQALVRIAEELLGLSEPSKGRRAKLAWYDWVGVAFQRVLGALLLLLICVGWLLRSAAIRLGLRRGR